MPSSSCRARRAGLAQLGQQPGQFLLLAGGGGGQLVGQLPAQGAQGGGEGREGQPVGADLDTAAERDDGARGRRPRRANSSTSRVLPTPASPPSSSACGSPAAARASASRSTPSSSARPTNTGLTDLVSTAPSIAQGSDSRGTGFRAAGRDGRGGGGDGRTDGRGVRGEERRRATVRPSPGAHAARVNQFRRRWSVCTSPSAARPRFLAAGGAAAADRLAGQALVRGLAAQFGGTDLRSSYSNMSFPSGLTRSVGGRFLRCLNLRLPGGSATSGEFRIFRGGGALETGEGPQTGRKVLTAGLRPLMTCGDSARISWPRAGPAVRRCTSGLPGAGRGRRARRPPRRPT